MNFSFLFYVPRDRQLVVLQVDIVDFNGSFLARVRDLVGANPIILVITKVRFYNMATSSILSNYGK
jgi:ribosome biogenesis GTPase A